MAVFASELFLFVGRCGIVHGRLGLYTNTQVYNLVPDETLELPRSFWLGLLNSRMLWFFLINTGNVLRGGYFRFKINYLSPFPVPVGKEPAAAVGQKHSQIAELVDLILALRAAEAAAKAPQEKERLRREIETTDRRIDQLVYDLYALTPEEIRLVEQATAPSCAAGAAAAGE